MTATEFLIKLRDQSKFWFQKTIVRYSMVVVGIAFALLLIIPVLSANHSIPGTKANTEQAEKSNMIAAVAGKDSLVNVPSKGGDSARAQIVRLSYSSGTAVHTVVKPVSQNPFSIYVTVLFILIAAAGAVFAIAGWANSMRIAKEVRAQEKFKDPDSFKEIIVKFEPQIHQLEVPRRIRRFTNRFRMQYTLLALNSDYKDVDREIYLQLMIIIESTLDLRKKLRESETVFMSYMGLVGPMTNISMGDEVKKIHNGLVHDFPKEYSLAASVFYKLNRDAII